MSPELITVFPSQGTIFTYLLKPYFTARHNSTACNPPCHLSLPFLWPSSMGSEWAFRWSRFKPQCSLFLCGLSSPWPSLSQQRFDEVTYVKCVLKPHMSGSSWLSWLTLLLLQHPNVFVLIIYSSPRTVLRESSQWTQPLFFSSLLHS